MKEIKVVLAVITYQSYQLQVQGPGTCSPDTRIQSHSPGPGNTAHQPSYQTLAGSFQSLNIGQIRLDLY